MFEQHIPPEFARFAGLAVCVAATCLVLLADRLFLSGRKKRQPGEKARLFVEPETKKWRASGTHRPRAHTAFDEAIERSWR
jgi:hypothetical protein